uniref:Tudor domain-containing protein n=1 Tax=Globodera pallida TaxID=36090 RepID=A0A183C8E6_GLOPA
MAPAGATKKARKNKRRRSRKHSTNRMFVNHAPRIRKTVKTEKETVSNQQQQQQQNDEVEEEGGCVPGHQHFVPDSDNDDEEIEVGGGFHQQQQQNGEREEEADGYQPHEEVVPESDDDDEQRLRMEGENEVEEQQQQQQLHPEQNEAAAAASPQHPNNNNNNNPVVEEEEYEIKCVHAVYTHLNGHRAYFIGWTAYRGIFEWVLSVDVQGVEIIADFYKTAAINATLSAVLGKPVCDDLLRSIEKNKNFEKVRSQMEKTKPVRTEVFNIAYAENTPAYIRKKAEKELQAFVSKCM